MKLKIVALVIFLTIPCNVFARFGFGVQQGFSLSREPESFISLSGRSDEYPWGFAMSFNFEPDFSKFKGAYQIYGDNWFVNKKIAEHLDYFLIWGFSTRFRKDCDNFEFTFGGRSGGGLDFYLAERHFEFFIQTVWNPNFGIKGEGDGIAPSFYLLNFPSECGIRIWF